MLWNSHGMMKCRASLRFGLLKRTKWSPSQRRIDRSGVGQFEHHVECAAFSQHAEQDGFASSDLGERAAKFTDGSHIGTVHFLDEIAFVKAFRLGEASGLQDRKSTRLNSSHLVISYA